jgi:UDP-glucose 4-epimerase
MLLDGMNEVGVKNIIFSSTAGVYGNPERVPIQEDDRKIPTNPYGESKLMVERMLAWHNTIHGLNYAVLRYFNACGAMLDGSLGEGHNPETHIIPIALKSAVEGHDFVIYGSDYSTPDGTCVRDYIHVLDLAEAHLQALEKIMSNPGGYTYNVGTGKGHSNKEIAQTIQEVTGLELKIRFEDRRPGDADELVADVTRIKNDLHFEPKHSDLPTIIRSAYAWHSKKQP